MGLCGQLLFFLLHYNVMNLIIIPWTGYVILVGYLFSHINNPLVGIYNFLLQIWVFPGNFSDNNVFDKMITGCCSVSFPST